MSITSEITRIKTAIADVYTACQEMGATMPAVLNSDNLEQCIASISGGQPVLQHRYNWENENDLAVKRILTVPFTGNYALRYASGVYIANTVGSSTYYTSNDLENWTSRTAPDSITSFSLYVNDTFFCLKERGESNRCYFSSDGINWTSRIFPSSASRTVFVVNNKFFVTSKEEFLYTDGNSDWSSCILPSSSKLVDKIYGIAYGNNMYLAIRSDSSNCLKSSDGITWINTNSQTSFNHIGNFGTIIYANGYFVVAHHSISSSQFGSQIQYSLDGKNWSQRLFDDLTGVGYDPLLRFANGTFFIKSTKPGIDKAYYATDPSSTWTQTTIPYVTTYYSASDTFFYVQNENVIYHSIDGHTWNILNLPSNETWASGFSVTFNKLYKTCTTSGKMLEIGNPNVYTLDKNPTTSSVVYDLPNTPSALTITGVETGTITLSDSNTYTYNAEGDIEQ